MTLRTFVLSAAPIPFVIVPAATAHAQFGFPAQIVAASGRTIFGSTTETFAGTLDAPINSFGAVAFSARVNTAAGQKYALYRWQGGQGSELAREGALLGNHATLHYQRINAPVIDDTGQLAFTADFGSGNNDLALLSTSATGVRVEALPSTAPPAPSPYASVSSVSSFCLSRTGKLELDDGAQNVRKFWVGTRGDLAVVAQSGDPAPNYPAGTVIGQLGWTRLSDVGSIVLLGQMYSSVYNGQRALLVADRTTRSTPVGPGLPAPGVGGTYLEAGPPPSMNSAGVLGFSAPYVLQPGGPYTFAAWTGHNGSYQVLTTVGATAPGLPSGYAFESLDTPAVNHSGNAMFAATAIGPGLPRKQGLWTSTPQGLTLAIGEGQPVLNMPAGTVVAPTTAFSNGTSCAFNDRSQIALLTLVSSPGVPLRQSLLAFDPAEGVRALAVQGMPFELAPGDSRIVQSISMWNTRTSGTLAACTGDDGFGSPLNDSGQLAFSLFFNDSSTALVMTQIPAPGAALSISALVFASRRRRR